jgi:hypothetical protein
MPQDTNFPLKVVCPECRAAIYAKCQEKHFSLGGSTRNVDWFHFARIEKAKAEGFDITSTPFEKTGLEHF